MHYRACYIFRWKTEYVDFLRSTLSGPEAPSIEAQTVVVSATQGGFGEGVSDFVRSVKERFLEREIEIRQLGLEPSEETFDRYFELTEPDEFVDLDSE